MASQGWEPSRAIATEMKHRAARVRYPGEWLGCFEWIAWGVMRQVQVHMMFGEHIVDMMQTFAPDLDTYQPKSTHRAIAVRIHEGSLLTSVSLDSLHPCVNHYVAGRPIAGAPSPEAASTMGPVHGNCEDAALAASRQGWFLVETDCGGDCGVDAMACNEPGIVRGAKVWKSIRMELSDFMSLRASDRLWQEAFRACCEDTAWLGGSNPPIACLDAAVPTGKAQNKQRPSEPSARPFTGHLGEASNPHLPAFWPPDPCAPTHPPPLPPPATVLREASGASSAAPLPDPVECGAASLLAVSDFEFPPETAEYSFEDALEALPSQQLERALSSLALFRGAEVAWRSLRPTADATAKARAGPRAPRKSTKLQYRIAVGRDFLRWHPAYRGAQKYADYLQRIRAYPGGGKPPKSDKVWLSQCDKLVKEVDLQGGLDLRGVICSKLRNRAGRTMAERRRPNWVLERRRSAGARYKCPAIREALWHWFVDIRASLRTTISPRFVLMKANEIAEHCLADMKREGRYTPMPLLNKHWLFRWKADYGVSYRRPNVRFKCSLPVLQRRMRAMWCNNIRVRHLAKRTLGHDLSHSIHGIDEKPIHFNEAPHRTPCRWGGGLVALRWFGEHCSVSVVCLDAAVEAVETCQLEGVTACLDAAEEAEG